jgi:hypothetical protein
MTWPARLDQAAAGDHRICPAWVLLRQLVAALARQVSAGRRALYIVGGPSAGKALRRPSAGRTAKLWYGPSGTCDIEEDESVIA